MATFADDHSKRLWDLADCLLGRGRRSTRPVEEDEDEECDVEEEAVSLSDNTDDEAAAVSV